MSKNAISASATALPDHRLFVAAGSAAMGRGAAVRIIGDDNAPTLMNGDVAFLDTKHTDISPPGLYGMIDVYGKIVIHRLEAFWQEDRCVVRIMSDNPRGGERLALLEDVVIAGRVCGAMKVL